LFTYGHGILAGASSGCQESGYSFTVHSFTICMLLDSF